MRPGLPMIRKCTPSDIMRGRDSDSASNQSKLSIAYVNQSRGVSEGAFHIFMSLESSA